MTTLEQHIQNTKPTTVQAILAEANIQEKQKLIVDSLIHDVPHVNPFLYPP